MAKNDIMNRVLKASGNPLADVFKDSKTVANKQEAIKTDIPMLNVALSGKWDGGLVPGVTIFAAPSKHFKSMLGLVLMKAFLDKFEDGIVLFVDSEFGFGCGYMESLDIDTTRVAHVPVTNIEDAKFQLVAMLETLKTEKTKVFIFYDSLGNTASKKELNDAIDQNTAADMSRAKSIKSFFRIVTPMINLNQYYMVVINHVYSCLDSSQKVRMENGKCMNIDKIQPGDIVQTANGPKCVTDTMNFELDSFIELEMEDGSVIKCTPNHKFSINGNWIEAEFLQDGMELDIF